jgi:NADPH-dependent curcumin reductase CurA
MLEGKITIKHHEFNGLESVPEAMNALFEGTNTGKVMVHLKIKPSL